MAKKTATKAPAVTKIPVSGNTAHRFAFKDENNKTLLVLQATVMNGTLHLTAAHSKSTLNRNIEMFIYDHSGVLADNASLEIAKNANPDDFASFEIRSTKLAVAERSVEKARAETMKSVTSMLKDVELRKKDTFKAPFLDGLFEKRKKKKKKKKSKVDEKLSAELKKKKGKV